MTDDPLKGLDWPTPAVVIEEAMIVRVGLFKCDIHDGRLETEFSIHFPHDDSFEVVVSLAANSLSSESWSRVKAVGTQLTDIILEALKEANGENSGEGGHPEG